MNEDEERETVALEDEIKQLKNTLTNYRYTLLYVSGMVTLGVIFEILDRF